MEEILKLIISGYYSDYFFNIIITQFLIFIQNNFALLWIGATLSVKAAKLTKNTYDDKISAYFVNFLSKFHKTKPIKKGKK